MTYLAALFILAGIYFVDSAVKNRAPVAFLRALIEDPSDVRKTLDAFNGKWTTPPGEGPARGTSGRVEKSDGLGSSDDPRNGRLSSSELKGLSWSPGQRLTPAAAEALTRLNAAYKAEFGRNIAVTDSYRTLAEQRVLKVAKPRLAAPPGTSNHGLGLAVDLAGGVNSFGTRQYSWMMANAPGYGWVNPSWAQQSGDKPEPWHWEFVGGVVAA